MASKAREYELVIFGATGHTGKYCVENVLKHLPTDLKWAVVGRSQSKLQAVLDEYSKYGASDRRPPGIEICSLEPAELDELAKKTSLIVSTVGPYSLYGEQVVRACAQNGTHYVDTTGEMVWTKDMIEKYGEVAKKNGAILMSQIGFESVASDIVVYALADRARGAFNRGLGDTHLTIYDIKGAFSGGTLSTVLSVFDVYSVAKIMAAGTISSMLPDKLRIKGLRPGLPASNFLQRFFGTRTVSDLGVVSTSPNRGSNLPIVGRSWALLQDGEFYGPNFKYMEYLSVRNVFMGLFIHSIFTFGPLFILFPPLRWLLKRLVTQPGSGPSREQAARNRVEIRAVGAIDGVEDKKVFATMRFAGDLYDLTGLFMTSAAISILRDDTEAKKMGGGYLTSACLGQKYIQRLEKGGVQFDTRIR